MSLASTTWAAARSGWLARRGGWQRAGLAALAGAACTLAQVPVSAVPVLFIAVPALVWLVAASPGPRAAAVVGWAAGFGYFTTGLHWIGHSFLVDAERFAWLLPFAVTLLPAYLALWWGVAVALARWLWPSRPWARVLAVAVAITSAEVARSVAFTGFSWNLPSYALVETPLMQAASWAGPFGLTLLMLTLAGLPLVAGPRSVAAWAGVALLGAGWVWGTDRLSAPTPVRAEPVSLRIVQANAAQHLKWAETHRDLYAARYRDLSALPPDPALGPPDMVIWPEIALTFLPQDSPQALAATAQAAGDATLLTGTLFYQWDGPADDPVRRWSNALAAVAPDGTLLARYDKQHLVPWGEYLPQRWLLERLGLAAIAGMTGGGFVPGQGSRIVDAPGLPPMAVAICYEMIFADEVIGAGPRPEWILHITNDSWFGSFAGPQQHLAQARIRAIEQGLPVARAAQTGISAVIDPYGRVGPSLALGTHGHIDAALPGALPPTLYARSGDWPTLALLLLGWGWMAVATSRTRRRALG